MQSTGGRIPAGPRGVKGAPTYRQALVTASTKFDRREVGKRRNAKGPKVVSPRTPNEFDLLPGDFLMTPQKEIYRDNEDPHSIPVISTVAGIEKDEKTEMHETLDKYVFAGVCMSRIVEKPENGSVVAPQTDVSSQIGGTVTVPIYCQDAPFGAAARLVPNPNPATSHGYMGNNHRHLVVEIDHAGSRFGDRYQTRCYNNFHRDPMEKQQPKSATEQVLAKSFDHLTDYLMMGKIAWDVAEREMAKTDGATLRAFGDNTTPEGIENRMKSKVFRLHFMKAMYPGLGSSGTIERPQDGNYLYTPRGGFNGGTSVSAINTKQITSSADFFSSVWDVLRVDNMWRVGKVIRGGKAPGECDILLD
jgi:hypothetical protein